MIYKITYYKGMPKAYREKVPVTLSKEIFEAVALSKTITIEGEKYTVKTVHTDADAEISYVEVDNNLRPM
jgi:hypothetical protein